MLLRQFEFIRYSPWRRAGVFLLLLLILLVGAHEFLQGGLRRRRDFVSGRWNCVRLGEINAQILIVGSSRAQAHYDTSILGECLGKSCYNMGAQGTFLNLQAPLLRIYLKDNKSPEVVLLDVHSLSPREEVYEPSQYTLLLNEPDIYQELLIRDPLVRFERYIPLFSVARWGLFRAAGVGWLGLDHHRAPMDVNGYLPNNRVWNEDRMATVQNEQPLDVEATIDPREVQHLTEMLNRLASHQIPVILICSPVFYEEGGLITNDAEEMRIFRSLAEKHHVPFWDYSQDDRFQNRCYFSDHLHLNSEGTVLFSSLIATRVECFLAGGSDAL